MPRDPLYFPRLQVELLHDSLGSVSSCQAWRTHSRSAMIQATERRGAKTLRTLSVTLYGDHRVVATKRVSGVAWDEVEHQMASWFSAHWRYQGWLLELRSVAEVAA